METTSSTCCTYAHNNSAIFYHLRQVEVMAVLKLFFLLLLISNVLVKRERKKKGEGDRGKALTSISLHSFATDTTIESLYPKSPTNDEMAEFSWTEDELVFLLLSSDTFDYFFFFFLNKFNVWLHGPIQTHFKVIWTRLKGTLDWIWRLSLLLQKDI